MNSWHELHYDCPICGERNDTSLEAEPGMTVEYTEDCVVCCRPNRIVCRIDPDGNVSLSVEFEG